MSDILVTDPVPLSANVTTVNPVPINAGIIATQPVPILVVVGSQSQILVQATASSSWSFANPFGRLCGIDIYIGNELVEADTTVSTAFINITFAAPVTGFIVVT